MMLDLIRQHFRIPHWMKGEERLRKARRESCLGFSDAIFGSSHFRGVAGDEVEHRLFRVKLGYRWQHASSVTR